MPKRADVRKRLASVLSKDVEVGRIRRIGFDAKGIIERSQKKLLGEKKREDRRGR